MVNARTLAIGTFAIAGCGMLAAVSTEGPKYTAYKVDEDTTLYVNNDFEAVPEGKQLEIIYSGDVVPEDGNAGFLEIDMGSDTRMLLSTSYDILQHFDGDVETSCSAFIPQEHPSISLPEGAKEGDFSAYTLKNGVPSYGPVGANIQPRDCTNGRQGQEGYDKLYDHALEHASETHGLEKRMLSDGGYLSCNLGRESAELAYYDPGVGQHNQCAFIENYRSAETGERANVKLTRVSGSQMDFFGANRANSFHDWGCNLGFGAGSRGLDFLIGSIGGGFRVNSNSGLGHRTINGSGSWGSSGGKVKHCYAQYANKSKPCVDPAAKTDPSLSTYCVGHSLGGGTCAAGKGLEIWDHIMGFNSVPCTNKSFADDGTSFRYTFGNDIASYCLFKSAAKLEWGYARGMWTFIENRRVRKRVRRCRRRRIGGNWRMVCSYVWATVEEPYRVGTHQPWFSSSCVPGAWPLTMFGHHSISKRNFRCPGESPTWTPSMQDWTNKFTGEQPKGPDPPFAPARR